MAQTSVKIALFSTPSRVKLFSWPRFPLTDGLSPPPPMGMVNADC